MQSVLAVPEPIPALPSPKSVVETHRIIFSEYERDASQANEPQEEPS